MEVTIGTTSSKSSAIGRFPWAKALLGIAVLAAVVILGRQAAVLIPQFAAKIDSLGGLGGVVFVAGYVLATVAFIPGSLLTLAAGAVFGIVQGTLYVFLAATTGAALAFLLSRHIARSAIERRVAGNERFAAIDRAIGSQGRKIVLLLRLSPVVPFNLLNYGLGLTKVRFVDYVVASVGMLPGTLLYVYYGKLAGDVAALATGIETMKHGAAYWAVLGLGLAATILVTTLITHTARRALQEATAHA